MIHPFTEFDNFNELLESETKILLDSDNQTALEDFA